MMFQVAKSDQFINSTDNVCDVAQITVGSPVEMIVPQVRSVITKN